MHYFKSCKSTISNHVHLREKKLYIYEEKKFSHAWRWKTFCESSFSDKFKKQRHSELFCDSKSNYYQRSQLSVVLCRSIAAYNVFLLHIPTNPTIFSLFFSQSMFRQGMHDLKVWPGVEGDGGEPTTTPGRTSSSLAEDQMGRLAKVGSIVVGAPF